MPNTIVYNFADVEHAALEVPAGIQSLAGFRRWVFSDTFPDAGRIDYVSGRIEVDVSADDLFSLNLSKTELASRIHQFVKMHDAGWLFSDGARVSCPDADLSVEPDVVFISHESVKTGRVVFRRSRARSRQGYLEIVGPPDLVIEVVSDSSVRKDTMLLPQAYFLAGVREFWLVDCRREQLLFDIQTRGRERFEAVPVTGDGYRESPVLGAPVRLTRQLAGPEMWRYDLDIAGSA